MIFPMLTLSVPPTVFTKFPRFHRTVLQLSNEIYSKSKNKNSLQHQVVKWHDYHHNTWM